MTTDRVSRRPQLSEEVADLVGNRIMAGELRPGDFIRLDETASNLGVSVTPVREALLTLRSEGLVDLVPRRGYSVSPLSRGDIDDMFWVQSMLAQEILRRSFANLTAAYEEELQSLVADFASAAAREDVDAIVEAQHQLFRSINIGSHSGKLVRRLVGASRYIPYRRFATDPEWRTGQVEINNRLAEAAHERDIEKGLSAIVEQFDLACARLVDYLDAAGIWDEDGDVAETASAAS